MYTVGTYHKKLIVYERLLSPHFAHIERSTEPNAHQRWFCCRSQLYVCLKHASYMYLLAQNLPMLLLLKGTDILLTQNGNNRTHALSIAINIYCTENQ